MPIVPTTTDAIQQAVDPVQVDTAKSWVFEKINQLKKVSNTHSVDLINAIDSKQYVENPGFVSGEDPGTYTNQKRDYISQTLQSPEFTPPNEIAAQLWNQETSKFTASEINSAINIEARTRINGRVNQVRSGINSMVDNINENPYPGNLFNSLEHLEGLIGTIDQQQQKDYPGYLPENMTKNMVIDSKRKIANAYISGNKKIDPLSTMNDIMEKSSFYKSLGLSDKDLTLHYQEAAKTYQQMAIKDVKTIIAILKDDLDKIQMNGGSLDSSSLAKLSVDDYSHDDFILKLAMIAPWFGDNLASGRRTHQGESQLTAVEEVDGMTYIFPTIRWNGINYTTYEDSFEALNVALDNGDAIPVKDIQQGNRISKHMSRLLSWQK